MEYVEPTVMEVLEAANGLRDADDLGYWLFPLRYSTEGLEDYLYAAGR